MVLNEKYLLGNWKVFKKGLLMDRGCSKGFQKWSKMMTHNKRVQYKIQRMKYFSGETGFWFFFLEFFWPVALGRFQKNLFCVVSRKDFFNKKCRGVIWLKIKATSTRMLCGSGLIHQWRTAHLSAQQKLASPPHTTHPPTSPTKQVSNHFTNFFIQKYLEYYEG